MLIFFASLISIIYLVTRLPTLPSFFDFFIQNKNSPLTKNFPLWPHPAALPLLFFDSQPPQAVKGWNPNVILLFAVSPPFISLAGSLVLSSLSHSFSAQPLKLSHTLTQAATLSPSRVTKFRGILLVHLCVNFWLIVCVC